MRLNHLDLSVPDVAQSRTFFETYFGLRCIVSVSRDDQEVAVLTDESGFALTLRDPNRMTNSGPSFDVEMGVARKDRTHGQTLTIR
jgi:catechol 2,3-dioxygenase-like lactoylglutathione lyase family enzyme